MATTGAGQRAGARRLAGVAGLASVAAAAVENIEVLDEPTIGASAGEIRSAYADQAFALVTAAAGAVALLAYIVFAAGLFAYLRRRRSADA
ncbi:MAG TPA: hypothetical protein VK919_07230 [Solirubrobacterales bacterium]|nr:hypothetical protein [Solirubrobacterales bacterium]